MSAVSGSSNQSLRASFNATKPTSWRIELGRLGEKVALDWLTGTGYQIREVNWRSGRLGEIDIIAEDDGQTIVFVEVKTRKLNNVDFGFRNEGFESVNWRKRKKIIACAFAYMAKQNLPVRRFRFDVIVVEFMKNQDAVPSMPLGLGIPTVRHVARAF